MIRDGVVLFFTSRQDALNGHKPEQRLILPTTVPAVAKIPAAARKDSSATCHAAATGGGGGGGGAGSEQAKSCLEVLPIAAVTGIFDTTVASRIKTKNEVWMCAL